MGLFTRAADTFYAFRFLRLLTTPWQKMGAYKLGLIDAQGNILRKAETSEERSKYNVFHKLVFNVKRLLNKLPFGKTTIASYLAALYLIKEKTGLSDEALSKALLEVTGFNINTAPLNESRWYLTEDNSLRAGHYTLRHDVALPLTGEVLALKKSLVTISENAAPCGTIFGVPVYTATHNKTRQRILITQHDIVQ